MPHTALPGLAGLKQKLEKIQVECGEGEDKNGGGGEKEKDDFIRLKDQAYQMLGILREKIRHRLTTLKQRGNNVETIQLGVRIQSMIKDMENMFPKLHSVVQKQAAGGLMRKRLSPEEVESRYNDIAALKRHLDEAKRSHQSNRELDESELDQAWSGSNQKEERDNLLGGANIKVDNTDRDMTEDESALVNRFAARDKEFDNILNDISAEVDALGEHANRIGEAADRQNVIINELSRKGEEAHDGVKDLQGRIKDIMEQDQNSTFCCRIIMILVLLGVIGIILQKLTG